MSWIQIDNGIGGHKRAMQIEDDQYLAAIGLHILGIAHCDIHRTDGSIPKKALRRICPSGYDDALSELLRVGFWDDCGDHYEIHHYLDWQRSSEQIETASKKAKNAAISRWGNAPSNAPSNAKRNAKRNAPREKEREKEKEKVFTPEREQTPSTFRECADLLSATYGITLNSTLALKVRRLCSDYEGKTPSAPERLAYAIQKAEEQKKPSPAYAVGIASSASTQEMAGGISKVPEEDWTNCWGEHG